MSTATQGASADGPERRSAEQQASYALRRLIDGEETAKIIAIKDLRSLFPHISKETKLRALAAAERVFSTAQDIELRHDALEFSIRQGLLTDKTDWVEELLQREWKPEEIETFDCLISGIAQHIFEEEKVKLSTLELAMRACSSDDIEVCLAYSEIIKSCLRHNPIPAFKNDFLLEHARVERILKLHEENETDPERKEMLRRNIEYINNIEIKTLIPNEWFEETFCPKKHPLLPDSDITELGKYIREKSTTPGDYVAGHFRAGTKAVFLGLELTLNEKSILQLTELIQSLAKENLLTHITLPLPIGKESEALKWAHSNEDYRAFPHGFWGSEIDIEERVKHYCGGEVLRNFLLDTESSVSLVCTKTTFKPSQATELRFDEAVIPFKEIWKKNPNARVLVLGSIYDCSRLDINMGESVFLSISKELQESGINTTSILTVALKDGFQPYSESLDLACERSSMIRSFGLDIGDSPLGTLNWLTEFEYIYNIPISAAWDGLICSINPDDNWDEYQNEDPEPKTDVPLPSLDDLLVR